MGRSFLLACSTARREVAQKARVLGKKVTGSYFYFFRATSGYPLGNGVGGDKSGSGETPEEAAGGVKVRDGR